MSTISVDYDVLNQKGSPAWYSDLFANIPTAGYKGRMFISTDTFAFYRDTGTGWDLIGGPGIGTLTGSGVVGQVSFFNGTQVLAGNNNLFWDNTNGRLGIGTATPGAPLDIHATGTNATFNGTSTNNAYLVFQNAGNSKWRIGNTYNAGANSFDIYNNGLTTNALTISSTTNDITINGNINTGVYAITSALLFSTSTLSVSNSGSVTGTNGISSFSGNVANNGFTFAPNNSSFHRFIVPTSSSYDWTFPATAGTIAILEAGTQTFTGTLNVLGSLGTKYGISIEKGNTPSPLSANDIFIYASSGATNIINFANSSYKTTLSFPTSNQTYTFPATTGTLALTSDLSSYLPLTGGTLTGQLYINPANTAITGLDVASNNTSIRSDTINGFPRQLLITMGSGTLIQLTAKGYGANYITDLAFYTSTASGVNGSSAMYITANNNIGITTGSPVSTNLAGSMTIVKSYNSDTPTSTTAQTYYLNQSNLYLFGRNAGLSIISNSTSEEGTIFFGNASTIAYASINTGSGTTSVGGDMYFKVGSNTERMRITSAGIVCVGTTAGFTSGLVCSDGGTSYVPFAAKVGTTANSTQIFFNNPNGVVGSITTSGSVTSYNVTSDYRLKQDFKDYNGLDLVSSIKTYDYEWKSDNTRMYGVMAHELAEVIPYAVQGIKDGKEMQGVDYSKIVPILVKAIQELNKKLIKNNIN